MCSLSAPAGEWAPHRSLAAESMGAENSRVVVRCSAGGMSRAVIQCPGFDTGPALSPWCQVFDEGDRHMIAVELKDHVLECIDHHHANHVLRKCLEVLPHEKVSFIIANLEGNAEEVAKHVYGMSAWRGARDGQGRGRSEGFGGFCEDCPVCEVQPQGPPASEALRRLWAVRGG